MFVAIEPEERRSNLFFSPCDEDIALKELLTGALIYN
jgi:hypothetical protein